MGTETLDPTQADRDAFADNILATYDAGMGTAPTGRPEFHITDAKSADYILRKLANNAAEKERIKAQADAMLRLLDSDSASLMGRFGSELEAWAQEELQTKYKGKRKSLPLFHGTLAFRTVAPSLRVASEADALDTARILWPETIRQVETLDKAAFLEKAKEALDQTGEMLPGVERSEGREAFRIDFPKAGKVAPGKGGGEE
jgi:phage host-nuclease inhibitor protein Gam